MGGLDIRTAIAMHGLNCVENCITVVTPHKGSQLGDIGLVFMKYKPHHKIQCINLDPDHLPVQTINSLQNQSVGTRDMAVARNAKIDTKSISSTSLDKIITVEIGGATHSADAGIIRDVRVIIAIFNALMGIEPERPKYNYGYIIKRA